MKSANYHRTPPLRWAGVALAALGLSACNTVEGVGKDVQSAGKAIEKASDEVRSDMQSTKSKPASDPEARSVPR